MSQECLYNIAFVVKITTDVSWRRTGVICSNFPVCIAILHAKFCTDCNFLIEVTDVLHQTGGCYTVICFVQLVPPQCRQNLARQVAQNISQCNSPLDENCVTETKLTLLNYAYILRRILKKIRIIICPSFFLVCRLLSIVAFSHSENGLTILTEREFPLAAVRILAGKPFHSEASASNIYQPSNCCFFHFILCVRVKGFAVSSRVVEPSCLHAKKLCRLPELPYPPKRENSPPRVVSPTSCKRLIKFFKQRSGKISRPG